MTTKKLKLGDSLGDNFIVVEAREGEEVTTQVGAYYEAVYVLPDGHRVAFSSTDPEKVRAQVDEWEAEQEKRKDGGILANA